MSGINANIASLIARRAIGINHDSPNEALGTSRPGLCVRNGMGAALTADLPGRPAALPKSDDAAGVDSLPIAQENVMAAECAIHDVAFVIEVSTLTQARILIDSIDRPRRNESPGGQTGEPPDDLLAQC